MAKDTVIVAPPIGLTGTLVATYASVVLGTVVTYCATRAKIALVFLAAAVATIVITLVEQSIAIEFLGDKVSEYILHFNSHKREVHAKAVGTAPLDKTMWELPAAVHQLLSMTATFWTLYILDEYVDEQKKETPCVGMMGAVMRSGALWVVASSVMLYSVRHSFVSPMQAAVGVALGSIVGWICYKIGRMYGTQATCRA